MDEQQAERRAANEVLFRRVNEQLVGLNETFEPLDPVSVFVCECGRLGCAEQIKMTLAEYAAIRRNPRWFFVVASDDHVTPESERVVERTAGYFVVEKVGVSARIAERTATGVPTECFPGAVSAKDAEDEG